MSSVTLTTGTNAVHGLSVMVGIATTAAGSTTAMYIGVSSVWPSRKSRANAAMVRKMADVVSVTGARTTSAIARLPAPMLGASAGSSRVTVSDRLTRLASSDSIDSSHTARNLATTISTGRIGATSSVCMVPRSFSPAVRSTAAYIPPSTDKVSRM